MSMSQLITMITLVGTLLVAGIQLGKSQQQIADLERHITQIESLNKYLHGDIKP